MSDLIDRQVAINRIRHEIELYTKTPPFGDPHVCGLSVAAMLIEQYVPSAQPEIVRCKDCKWWDFAPDNTMLPDWHRCRYYGTRMHTTYEDFCSRGERREEHG